jgi:aryl-alcohol dehydrogenase-like predicted oxidoreductase
MKQIQMPQIVRGCWQLASDHSSTSQYIEPLINAIEAGFTTFDCADIYSGVEALLGMAAKKVANKNLQIHTKFVPDRSRLKTIDRSYIENIIDRSLHRLGIEQLALVQFHWWDWSIENYLPTMQVLFDLKKAGKIRHIGLTNVSRHHLQLFLDEFDIYSVQAQVSLFDRRAERGLSDLCVKNNIHLFAYGALLGGFIHEQWVNQCKPDIATLKNRSLVKYKLLIDSACGWQVFQQRLSRLKTLANVHHCSMAAIALAALLQAKKANAFIIGLSPQNFASQNSSLQKLPVLTEPQVEELTSWTCSLTGDAFEVERDKSSAHAKVMKYELNA